MPDFTGKLSQAEIDKALNWIRSQWGPIPATCSICKTAKWTLQDYVVAPPQWSQQTVLAAPVAFPQLILSCNKCGHSLFVSAVKAGIIPAANG
jgi:hypothetical protein